MLRSYSPLHSPYGHDRRFTSFSPSVCLHVLPGMPQGSATWKACSTASAAERSFERVLKGYGLVFIGSQGQWNSGLFTDLRKVAEGVSRV